MVSYVVKTFFGIPWYHKPTLLEDFEGETYDEDSKADLKFSCKICQVKLKTSKQYSAHMEHHNKLKQLLKLKCKKKKKLPPSKAKLLRNECRTCGKKFQKPSQLLRHERIHSGVKPYMVSNFYANQNTKA